MEYISNRKVYTVKPDMKEGKDYVNVSKYSESELGKSLAPGHPVSFDTIFGQPGNIRAAIDFVTMKNYPKDVMEKTKLSIKDIKRIPEHSLGITNYWSVVAYIISQRILSDKRLQQLMLENTAEYTSYNLSKPEELMGKKISAVKYNDTVQMGGYLMILRNYDKMIKDDMFNRDEIEKFIKSLMKNPDKDLFDKTSITVIDR